MSPKSQHVSQDTQPTRIRAAREGWGGCWAVAFSFLGVMGCVLLAYGVIAFERFPRTLDQYVSLKPGQMTTFRVTYANGATGFLTTTVVKANSESVSYATVYAQGQEAVQIHSVYTNWQGNPGELHSLEVYYARDRESLTLIAEREGGSLTEYTPPMVVWAPELLGSSVSNPLTGEVTLNGNRFTYAFWLERREVLPLPGGERDVIETRLDLYSDNQTIYTSLGTFANGIGLIHQEEFDGNGNLLQRLEVINSTRMAETPSLPMQELVPHPGTGTGFFRENAARTGAYEVSLPDTPFNIVYHLTLDANFTASPVVADGVVFTADQNGTLFAVEATTGRVRWQMGLGGVVTAAPAVAQGMVFVGASDKTLYAFTAQDGQFLWAFRLGDHVSTSPVVVDGVVYFGGEDRTLVAVDALTGQEIWRFAAEDRILSSPAVADGRVVFGADDGIVYALAQDSGAEMWRVALDSPVVVTPAVEGGVVYVGSTEAEFVAIALASGEELWKSRTAFGFYASSAVGKELVFTADNDGLLRALARADGSVAWDWRSDTGAIFIGSPLLLGNKLVIVDGDGVLYMFDAAAGTLVQRLVLEPNGVTGSPTWDGTTLYLTTQNRRVIALRNNDLAVSPSLNRLWELELGGAEAIPFAQPVELDGMIFAMTHDGNLWQVDRNTGQGQVVFRLGEIIEATPVVQDRGLYIGTSAGNLVVFDVDQRVERWRQGLAGAIRFAPLARDGRVFVHTRTETGGVVYALDADTGDVLWQFDTFSFGNSAPVWSDGYLIVSGDRMVALNPADGTEIWQVEDFVSFGGVHAGEGVVYAVGAGGLDEAVIAIHAQTGEVLWRAFVTGTFIFSRPGLDSGSGTLIAGAVTGQIYGLDATTGEIRWQFALDNRLQSDVQVQAGLVFLSAGDGTLVVLDAATGHLLANARLGTVGTFAPPLVSPDRVYALNGAVLYALDKKP